MKLWGPHPDAELTRLVGVGLALLLGYVLQRTDGHYHPEYILSVAAAWLLLLASFAFHDKQRKVYSHALNALLLSGLAYQLYLQTTVAPTIEMYGLHSGADLSPFVGGLIATGVLAAAGFQAEGWLGKAWFPLVVAAHFLMGCLVLKLAPTPHIDTWSIEIDSVKALLSGTNPFGITFANPYGDNSPFFPPGVSVNGRLQFGFVYPPLCLLLCVPGWLLGGDPRYSMLAAMGGAALLMGYARPGGLPKMIATLFLFTPRTWFVMDRAWTDPFVVLATAGVVFTACRYPKKLFIALGLYFCLKQHMWIGAPAALLLFPRPFNWKEIARVFLEAGAVGLGITLPFVLWGPGAFINSVLNIREVYRTDCLSLLAHWANTGVGRFSKWIGIGAMVPAAALGVLRGAASPAGFALAASATHFTLYLFSTHAFCNEWYNVVGGLFCAAAAAAPAAAQAVAAAPAPAPEVKFVAPAA